MLLLRPEEIEILQKLPPGQLYARVRLEQVLSIYSYNSECGRFKKRPEWNVQSGSWPAIS